MQRRNVLLMPVGSHGDVHPFIGVGLELARRGHAVHACTSGYFDTLFASAGIALDDVFPAERFRALLDDPRIWKPGIASMRRVIGMVVEHAASQYAYLAERARDPDLLVVASPLAVGARVAQDRHELRLATLQLAPSAIRSVVDPPRLAGLPSPAWLPLWARRAQRDLVDRLADHLLRGVNRLRREVGLAPARHIVGTWWNSPSLTVGLFPEWFSGRPSDWPASIRTTDFPLYDERDVTALPPGLGSFLDAAKADGGPLVFTPGSAMTQGADFFAAAAGACTALGRPGLLLTRHPDQVPARLPPDVHHFAYAPFSTVLPRAAALVHHGGIGTMAQAFAAGTPQVVMAMAHDQHDNAARARRLGVARIISRRGLGARSLARSLSKLLDDPDTGTRCTRVASRLAGGGGIAATCDLLEAMD